MRKITLPQIVVFAILMLLAVLAGIAATRAMLWNAPLGDFRGVALFLGALLLIFLCAIVAYRAFLAKFPLAEGPIGKGSREEFIYHIYLLFHLVLFQPLTRSHFVPVPLMKLVYLALGARLGSNSYSGGALLDPPLTKVGDNCIIGHDAVLFCHAVEGENLSLAPIRLGNNVTIGAKAVVMAGVTIGDGAIVAVNAVVAKGTQIGSGELWAGIPARRVR